MKGFAETARELAKRAHRNCPICKGHGWYLRPDKAPICCSCLTREEEATANADRVSPRAAAL